MTSIVWGAPAPEGQLGPPTHDAARCVALRDMRGSLPLTSGTASCREEHHNDVRRLDAGREH
jgi:hypothetical protein